MQRGTSLMKINLDEGAGAKPIAEQLRDILSKQAVRVIDLFREWDEDGDGTVSKKEFRKAMPMLGLEVPKKEIDALFDSWDPDGSGSLTLKELDKKLRRGAEVQLDDKLKARASPRTAHAAHAHAGRSHGASAGATPPARRRQRTCSTPR